MSLSVKREDLMLSRGAKGWTTRLKINDTNTHTSVSGKYAGAAKSKACFCLKCTWQEKCKDFNGVCENKTREDTRESDL